MRTFPNRTVRHDEKLVFGAATFHVIDLGPGESPHDSVWLLESDGPLQAFVGDLVYSRMHAYLADGFYDAWLANLSRVAAIVPRDTVFHMGHGLPGAAASLLDAQRTYIDTFIDAITTISKRHASQDAAVFAQAVTEHMKRLLPTDDLLFLMQLSIEPMRAKLQQAGV